jgi:RHS repeat-associated protein
VVYLYDGQMGTEDYEMNPGGSAKSLTRFGLGARGIDVVSRTTSSGSQVSYPLYDGHGNNVGSLLKNGASFTVADEKTYDAYGGLRSGGGADKGKYCASIGHKQDDESGLVYMRARYYEPTSGRFVSEDVAKDGFNWFVYCSNNPIGKVDSSGKSEESERLALIGSLMIIIGLSLMGSGVMIAGYGAAEAASMICKCFIGSPGSLDSFMIDIKSGRLDFGEWMKAHTKGSLKEGWEAGKGKMTKGAIVALLGYSLVLRGELMMLDTDFLDPYSKNEGMLSLL